MSDTPTSNWTDRRLRGQDFVAKAYGGNPRPAAPSAFPSSLGDPQSLAVSRRPDAPAPVAVPPRAPASVAPRPAPRPVAAAAPTAAAQTTAPAAAPVAARPSAAPAIPVDATPAYARARASTGKGRRGILMIVGGVLLLAALGAGWMMLNRQPAAAPTPADSLTVAPRTPTTDDALVGMPVTDAVSPETPAPAPAATAPAATTPAPTTAAPPAPAQTRPAAERPTTPPPAVVPAPDIQTQPLTEPAPQTTQPQPEPVPTRNWDPFLRGDAPVSTAEPPLRAPPSSDN